MTNLRKCVINEDVILGKSDPAFYYEEERRMSSG